MQKIEEWNIMENVPNNKYSVSILYHNVCVKSFITQLLKYRKIRRK